MKRTHLFALCLTATCVFVVGCASNPATGGKNVVLGSMEGEKKQVQKNHQEIVKSLGLYDDQATQEYVNVVGNRVARVSDLPNEEFKFFVIDDEAINAFTTGCCNGGLRESGPAAEHQFGSRAGRCPGPRDRPHHGPPSCATADARCCGITGCHGGGDSHRLERHRAARQYRRRSMDAGYGRENEMEADRLGMKYMVRAGYDPEAIGHVFNMFQAGEKFERARAQAEGREPRLYHGVFSSHPSPDERAVQAAKGAANIKEAPPGGWIERHDEYLTTINGIAYGSSKAQGIVRDNRFYHADLGFTVAFSARLDHRESARQPACLHADSRRDDEGIDRSQARQTGPREFLLSKLQGQSVFKGTPITTSEGNEGYAVVARGGSPIDAGQGPVRWVAVYRGQSVFITAGASRSAVNGVPEVDGLIMSVAETLRALKPSEFPLAEPYRIKVVKAKDNTNLSDYAADMPEAKFKKETLELINAMYPNKKPAAGQLFKIVE